MSYKLRTVIGIVLIELILAGIWYWMLLPGADGKHHWVNPAEGPAQVGRIMGMAMGGFLGFAPVLLFMAHMNDKKRRGR